MKKIKAFFLITALVLITVGVFAGKSKFQTISNFYYYSSSTYVQIATVSSINGTIISFTGVHCAIFASCTGVTYTMYAYDSGSGYLPLYVNF